MTKKERGEGYETRAYFKMAAAQDQNSALPNLKNLTACNFGKLGNEQNKVQFFLSVVSILIHIDKITICCVFSIV